MGMFGSTVLEIAVGVMFVYLVLGLIVTTVNEFLAQMLSLRAENLYEAVHGLFPGDDGARLAEDIYSHSLVASTTRKTLGKARLPSYISPSIFSAALTDAIGIKEPPGSDKTVDLTAPFVKGKMPYDSQAMDVLRPLLNAANNNLDKARQNIEKWYDDAMQRASGWYKRKMQVMTFLVSFAIVFVANADSLMIFDRLWANPVQRTAIEAAAKNVQPLTSSSRASQSEKNAALGLLGWTKGNDPHDPRNVPINPDAWFRKIIGLLITVIAASLGAPFWFDMLQKVINLRSAGTAPNEKPKNNGSASNSQKNRVASSDAAGN